MKRLFTTLLLLWGLCSPAWAQVSFFSAADNAALGKIELVWVQASNPESFRVYRDNVLYKTLPGTDRSFADTDIVYGKTYTYCIRPYSSGVEAPQVCDAGSTAAFEFTASKSTSDAYVQLAWQIDANALRGPNGEAVYFQIQDRNTKQEIYSERITDVSKYLTQHQYTPSHVLLLKGGAAMPFPAYTGSTQWTVEAMVRLSASRSGNPNLLLGTNSFALGLANSSNKVSLNTQSFNYSLPADQWVHLAFVATGVETRLFVNGVYTDKVSISPALTVSQLGSSVNGNIGNVRIWQPRRTAEELLLNPYRRLLGTEDGLAAYWPLDHGTGTNANDLTGGGRHMGILSNVWTPYVAPTAANASVPGSFLHYVGDSKQVNYQLNLFLIGSGTPTSQPLSANGSTLAFQAPVVNASNGTFADEVKLTWNSPSHLPSQFKIYRDDVFVGIVEAGESPGQFEYIDKYAFNSPKSLVSGKSHTYSVEAVSARFSKAYPKVNKTGRTFNLNFQASDLTAPNQVSLSWLNASAHTDALTVTRDGLALEQLPASATAYTDTNPVFGKKHRYGLTLSRATRSTVAAFDEGQVKANGTIAGRVTTQKGDFAVPGVLITARALVENDSLTRTATTDNTGAYQFNEVYYGRSAKITLTATRAGSTFQVRSKEITLSETARFATQVDFKDNTEVNQTGTTNFTLNNLQVQPQAAQDLVRLQWNYTKVNGQTTYFKIYRDNVLLDLLDDSQGNLTTYEDLSGIPGTAYTYAVAAYVKVGQVVTQKSVNAQATYPVVRPVQPVNFTAAPVATAGTANLSWTHTSTNITGFKLYRSEQLIKTVAKGETYQWVDLLGAPGTAHTYGIRAFVVKNGETYESGLLNAAAFTYPALATPTATAASAQAAQDQVVLSWTYGPNASYNYTGFRVYRGGTFIGTVLKNFPFTFVDREGIPGTAYTYTVKAFLEHANGLHQSAASNNAATTFPAVSNPTAFTATNGTHEGYVALTWNHASANHAGFTVSRAGTVVATLPTDARSYRDMLNEPGQTGTFSYQLKAFGKRGTTVYASSGVSASGRAAGSTGTTLQAPVAFTASQHYPNHVQVQWEYPAYILSTFTLTRDGNALATLATDQRSYQDYTAEPGRTYLYQLRASYNGTKSPLVSGEGRVSTGIRIAGTVTTQQGGYGVYGVQIKATGISGGVAFMKTALSDSTGFYQMTDLALQEGTAVTVAAQVQNHTLVQASFPVQITAGTRNYPVHFVSTAQPSGSATDSVAAITSVSVVPNPQTGAVEIRWSPSSQNYSGFLVYRGLVEVANQTKLQPRSFVDTKGAPGYAYQYRVRAYWETPDGRKFSNFKGADATFPALQPVQHLQATALSGQDVVVVAWSHPTNQHTHYEVRRNDVVLGTLPVSAELKFTDHAGFPNQLYKYTVTAVLKHQDGQFVSDPVAAQVQYPLVAPATSLTVTAPAQKNYVALAWQHSSTNFQEFEVFRDGALIRTLPNTARSFSDSLGLPETQHQYQVVAVVQRGGNGYSAKPATGQITYPKLVTPTSFSAIPNAGQDQVTLTWSYAPTGVNGFRVYRNNVLIQTLTEPSANKFIDQTGNPGTAYTYTVAAYAQRGKANTAYESGRASAAATFPALSAPTNLQASDGTYFNHVLLTWDHASTSNDGFEIYRDGALLATVGGGVRLYEDVINTAPAPPVATYSYTLKSIRTIEGTKYSSTSTSANTGYAGILAATNKHQPGGTSNGHGNALAISGDWAAVGSPVENAVYLYKKIVSAEATYWQFKQKITNAEGGSFGQAVGLDGTWLVVGNPSYSSATVTNKGRVHVYGRSGDTWSINRSLEFSDALPNLQLGYSVAISGNTIVAGAPTNTYGGKSQAGTVYFFSRSSGSWTFEQFVVPSTHSVGQWFGFWVDIEGNRAVVGEGGFTAQSTFYLFEKGTTWTEKAHAHKSVQGMGRALSLNGDLVLASSINEPGGAAYLYRYTGSDLVEEQRIAPPNANRVRTYGVSLGFRGNYAVVGAYGDDTSPGAAYIYKLNGNTLEEEDIIQENVGNGNRFGYRVATSADDFVVTASEIKSNFFYSFETPLPPATVTATKGTLVNQTKIEWTHPKADKLSKFEVYRDRELIASPGANQNFALDSDGIPGKKYLYQVKAVSQQNKASYPKGDIGFRKGNGVIRGSVVTQMGSSGVPNVNITATTTVAGERYQYTAKTDLEGKYEIREVYYGETTEYTVSVAYLDHAFVKNQQAAKLTLQENIAFVPQFQDKTAYLLRGIVKHQDISCGLDSAKVTLKTFTTLGEQAPKTVYTNAKGEYSFVINPLDPELVRLSVSADPLRIKGGLSTADTTWHQWQYPSFNLTVFDTLGLVSTRIFEDVNRYPVQLVVQNTCGPIGSNRFYVNVRSMDGCYDQTFRTLDNGKVTVNLPPLAFQMKVTSVDNSTPATLAVVDYLNVRPVAYDLFTLHNEAKAGEFEVPGEELKVEFTYHSVPRITVAGGLDRFLCDDPTMPAVVEQASTYTLALNVNERHQGQNCPVSSGFLVIKNMAADTTAAKTIHFEKGKGFPAYTFTAGQPNTISPYLHNLIIEYHTESDGFLGELIQPILVLGQKSPPGNDIVVEVDTTSGGQVQLPLFVLRDPPGDGSYSFIEKGSSMEKTLTITDKNLGRGGMNVNAGFTIFGVGGSVGLEIESGGGSGRSASFKVSSSVTERLQTSAAGDIVSNGSYLVGEVADVIVGAGLAIKYGIAEEISLNDQCQVVKSQILTMAPSDIKTQWVYPVSQIEHLINGYTRQLEELEAGTFRIEGKTKVQTKAYLTSLKENWQEMLRFHRVNTLPHFNLCDPSTFPNMPEPFRSQALGWRKQGFCNLIGSYKTVNGVEVFELKPFEWNTDLLERYNKVLQVSRSLEVDELDSDYIEYAGSMVFTETKLKNVPVDAEYRRLFGADAENITFAGGTEYSKEVGVSTSRSRGYDQNWYFDGEVTASLDFKATTHTLIAAGFGVYVGQVIETVKTDVQVGAKVGYRFEFEKTSENTVEETVKTGYVLTDDDDGDQFSVTVIRGIAQNHTPYFSLLGGRSSCPTEVGTIARDVPLIAIEDANDVAMNSTQYNVEPNKAAVFPLKLSSGNVFGEDRLYEIYLAENTNKYNAVVKVAGTTLNATGGAVLLNIPAGGSVYTNVSIERGPGHYQHDDIQLGLRPICDTYFNSTLLDVAVYFRSPCSPISIMEPGNNWVINGNGVNGRNKLLVKLTAYDVYNEKMQQVTLQYRRLGTNDWTDIFTRTKEELLEYYEENKTSYPLPTYPFEWDITERPDIKDGNYELRAKSECGVEGVILSNVVAGVVDRSSLAPFGTPIPGDGYLVKNQKISVKFDRSISCSADYTTSVSLVRKDNGDPIPFQIVCDGNLLTLEVSAAVLEDLENVELQATVSKVKAADTNLEQKYPVVWTFRVNVNPVFWDPAELNAVATQGTPATITAELKNGAFMSKAFTLTDYPQWLTPAVTSGTILSTNVFPVHFAVDPELRPGRYTGKVAAVVDGSPLEMTVNLELLAIPVPWAVNPANFQYSMNITAQYSLSDANTPLSTDTRDIIGVFVNGRIRGMGRIEYVPEINKFAAFITVYSNEVGANKETLTFRMWNALTGVEYGAKEKPFFVVDGQLGRPQDPYILHPEGTFQTIPLKVGWNWVSLNVVNSNMGIDNLLGSLMNPDVGNTIVVKSQTQFSEFKPGSTAFTGQLKTLNNTSGYMIHLSTRPDTLRVLGTEITTPVNIPLGGTWNWIGYPKNVTADLNTALQTLSPTVGDVMKSQTRFAEYNAFGRWFGSLKQLEPGFGYKLKLTQPGHVVLNNGPLGGSPVADSMAMTQQHEYNMTMTATLRTDGQPLPEGLVLAAYLNEQLRGVAPAEFLPDLQAYRIFLTIHGDFMEAGQVLQFRVVDKANNRSYPVEGSTLLTFEPDRMVGNVVQPYELSNPQLLAVKPKAGQGFDLAQNYPNPFTPHTTIQFTLPTPEVVRLVVYNQVGQVVRVLIDGNRPAGTHEVKFEAKDLPTGIYTYQLRAGKSVMTRKMVLVK